MTFWNTSSLQVPWRHVDGLPASSSLRFGADAFTLERYERYSRNIVQRRTTARACPQLGGRPAIKQDKPNGHSLLNRLTDNEASLITAYRSICGAVSDGAAITPAAEWLIDNFHQVERQIRQVRLDLPPRYYRQLPKLADGPFAGYPRVFGMAWAFVAHTDSRFDVDAWCRLRPRLSDRTAAYDRRTLGVGDYAADYPYRESQTDRRAYRL